MKIDRTFRWGLTALIATCSLAGQSTADDTRACSLLRAASVQVDDVPAGVALSLRVSGTQLEVISLQDYAGHLVDAWNEAEQGIVQRCFPRVKTSAGREPLLATAALSRLLDGVRIQFKPVDPAQLAGLRAHVHRRRARTLSCACEERDAQPPLTRSAVH